MSCLPTFRKIKVFELNPSVEGQDESAMQIFQRLQLSKSDIDLLYTAFWDIDADGSGLIRPNELFSYFEVEGTPFELALFSLFDEDHSGMINFLEFVCALWNLLTISEDNYGTMAFLLKEPTGKSVINYVDLRSLLEMLHNKRVDKDPSLMMVYQRAKNELNNKITLQQFVLWVARNPSVTSPLMMLQLHIRSQIIGRNFWMKLTEQRKNNQEQSQIGYVEELKKTIISQNNLFRERLIQEEKEKRRLSRRGKGQNGDKRDKIIRQESMLLGYFSLKQVSFKRPTPNQRKKMKKALSRILPFENIEKELDIEDGIIENDKPAAPKNQLSTQTNQSSKSNKPSKSQKSNRPSKDIINSNKYQSTSEPSDNDQDEEKGLSKVSLPTPSKDRGRRRRSLLKKPKLIRDAE